MTDSDTSGTKPQREATDFQVVFEEPPAAANSAAGGALFRAMEMLTEHPGKWARVAHCKSKSGANSIWTSIKKGTRRVPSGQWEYTCRIDQETGTSRLYARYLGPEPTPANDSDE